MGNRWGTDGESMGIAHDFLGDLRSRGKRVLVDKLTARRIDVVSVICQSHYSTHRRCRPIHPLRSPSPSPNPSQRRGWRRSSVTTAPRPARWSLVWCARQSAGSAPHAEQNVPSSRSTILSQGFPVIGKSCGDPVGIPWGFHGNPIGNRWDFPFQNGARFPRRHVGHIEQSIFSACFEKFLRGFLCLGRRFIKNNHSSNSQRNTSEQANKQW